MNKAHRLLLEAADFEVPKDDDDRKAIVRKQLDTLNTKLHFGEFQLPLTPKMLCHSIKVEKCKIMDSKKKPLWLVLNNADDDGDPIVVMFKTGDDLRQDKLTLQVRGRTLFGHGGWSDLDECLVFSIVSFFSANVIYISCERPRDVYTHVVFDDFYESSDPRPP